MDTLNTGILACPSCKSDLSDAVGGIRCDSCGFDYKQNDGRYYFVNPGKQRPIGLLDRLKISVKKYSRVYNLLTRIISPVYLDNSQDIFIRKYFHSKSIALNLGSGNSSLKGFINFDIVDYDNVNIVCTIEQLPIRSNSADIVVCNAVLEHVADDKKVVAEIYRVLKPGGVVYCLYPFIQGFHASPVDYARRTQSGVASLFEGMFIQLSLRCSGGPTSGLLWVLQEWTAILFSFGSRRLHGFIYIIVMVLTFPLKYLDILLARHPNAKNISSGFIYVGQKIHEDSI